MIRWFTYLILIQTLMVALVSAQETALPDTVKTLPGITIESSVDRAEVYIGDLIQYKLAIIYDSTYQLTPPPIGANLGAFDVKDYSYDDKDTLDDGRIKLQSRFRLTTFTTGDYIIPPIQIEFILPDSTRKILISEPMPIKIKSLLAEGGDTTNIKELKEQIIFYSAIPTIYYVYSGTALLVIAALIFWWIMKRRKKEAPEIVDSRDPWEIAFEQLAFLKEKNYTVSGEFKMYYIELTEIVRGYLQRIYIIPVLDMTTSEFLQIVRERELSDKMYDRFKKFLEFGDLVKFAKWEPNPSRMEDDYIEAWSIIEEIRLIEISRPKEIPMTVATRQEPASQVVTTEEETDV